LRSALLLAAGELTAAAELGLSVAEDEAADGPARLRAVTAAAAGLSARGEPERALQLCEDLLPVAALHAAAYARGTGLVLAQSLVALNALGRFDECDAILAAVREGALSEGDEETANSGSLALARIALARGDVRRAGVLVRDVLPALREYDPAGYLPWCLGIAAQVAGQSGDVEAATAAAGELRASRWTVRTYDHEVAVGLAWAASVAGEIGRPVETLLAAAETAEAKGHLFAEGFLRHEALRLGGRPHDLVERLEACAAGGRLPVNAVFHEHAVALATDDPVALETAGASFEQAGLLLFAAEAAAEAAAAYHRAGRASSAERSAGRMTRLLESCPGARTPALRQAVKAPKITRRELEICQLAARGMSNGAIAEQLVVSVRTVEGHLLRAMTKLGVSTRIDLGPALGLSAGAAVESAPRG
jgi:ATP/maltotriose-dependent transcriptional regulator MalT